MLLLLLKYVSNKSPLLGIIRNKCFYKIKCKIVQNLHALVFQYYRQARMKALHSVFPDYKEEMEAGIGMLNYPRPYSEPPSPSSSRVTTPVASRHGSDDENDSVDSEGEVSHKL